jgi:1-acyl-sn-glycerol-3-phosphate acyltransferase
MPAMANPQDAANAFPEGSKLVYECVLFFWKVVCNIFFREVRPRGAYNIPRTGPVILVVAPHSNQVRHHKNTRYDDLV